MCGIAGIMSLSGAPVERLTHRLEIMGELIAHRGPDDNGIWCNTRQNVGFAHARLSIIDLSSNGAQPMHGPNETIIVHNGEIYNYLELQNELKDKWDFRSTSDTETILASHAVFGENFVDHLRGMFASVIYDEKQQKLTAVRDRFGIKPLYYAVIDNIFYFASEAKAIVPFLHEIETDCDGLTQYLTFQYALDDNTLFKNIKQLMPAHSLIIKNGSVQIRRYWDINYGIDWNHSPEYFYENLREKFQQSIALHLRSDVPVGAYVSGGIDSSLISALSANANGQNNLGFHGKFTQFPGYDESDFAEIAAQNANIDLAQMTITADDFRDNIENVIYHLDYPVGGPGSFSQYMVSQLAAKKVKVVLGGQGGDEIFGGYARYVVAYLEQCIKASLDGSADNGNYVVTLASIIPNLGILREYKPMMQKLWSEGLFGNLDQRYFRLIDRSTDMRDEINWDALSKDSMFAQFESIFNSPANVGKEAYFDKMTHFDFKCLLPALLHVEDRMGMAHGLETRVPMLDHKLVEFAATIPANVKFEGGNMKQMLKIAFKDVLPEKLINRRDKMGFPVPLKEWFGADLKDFVQDIFSSQQAKSRPFMHADKVVQGFADEAKFSRKTWGLLSLEIWHQQFHDRAAEWKAKLF